MCLLCYQRSLDLTTTPTLNHYHKPWQLWSCQKQIMSEITYAVMIINLLYIIIMLFIRFVLNYGFVKKNLPIKKRLRKLLLLCFYQTWSWSINIVLVITSITQNLYKTSFRQKNMMTSPWEIITNALLVRPHSRGKL